MEIKIRYVAEDLITDKIYIEIFTLEDIELGKVLYWIAGLPGLPGHIKIIAKDLFTGKQDKNDKDIYDNDLWERDGFIATIKFASSQWILEKAPLSECSSYPAFHMNAKNGAVKGNIHQKPNF